MQVLKPPAPLPRAFTNPSFFLAGSIEMGQAEDWQVQIGRSLEPFNCTILNPRRPDWDSGWTQSVSNPQFHEQVVWELTGMERAHHILLYLAPGTKSPISLLELGLHIMGAGGELVVCCPEGFWRKGNVDIVCERYQVPQVPALNDLALHAIEEIKRWERTHASDIERQLDRD